MATVSAAAAAATTAVVARAAVARPNASLGVPQLRARSQRVRCAAHSKEGAAAAVSAAVKGAGASVVAATAAAAPALALVDERMSTEGTGLSLGLSNNLLGWILLGVFGLIWSLYTVYTSDLDEDEESGGLSL